MGRERHNSSDVAMQVAPLLDALARSGGNHTAIERCDAVLAQQHAQCGQLAAADASFVLLPNLDHLRWAHNRHRLDAWRGRSALAQ